MPEKILAATVFEVNPESHCCKDCGKALDAQEQVLFGGKSITIITCWTPGCLLATVTLSVDQYSKLTEVQFEAYREMNRTRALGRHVVSAVQA